MALIPESVLFNVSKAIEHLMPYCRYVDCGVISSVLQAANSGGFDFVFLHPEYLRDRSGGSLLVALRNNGISVAAYGYEPGFAHELIASAGINVFMSGPTPQGLDLTMLGNLTAQMQAQAGMMAASGGIQVWPA